MKKIAIMTAGGDCPGLNAAIKSVVLSANRVQCEVVGVIDGYRGLVEGEYIQLTPSMVTEIEEKGGTILGSSNKECPFYYLVDKKSMKYEDKTDETIKKLKAQGIEGLIVIGGDGTLDSARVLNERGIPTVGIPKTIDNDMVASMPTIGFETAVQTVAEAISKVKTTACSHRRVITVEIMGRTSGFLALYGGVSGGADVILLPEKDYDLDVVCQKVKEVAKQKRYAIVAVSESAKQIGTSVTISKLVADSFEQVRYGGVAEKLANEIEKKTGIECRHIALGHMQRGGAPITSDIILAFQLGNYAFELLNCGEYGYIIGMQSDKLIKMEYPKERVPRLLDFDDNSLIKTAKAMGICFGEEI